MSSNAQRRDDKPEPNPPPVQKTTRRVKIERDATERIAHSCILICGAGLTAVTVIDLVGPHTDATNLALQIIGGIAATAIGAAVMFIRHNLRRPPRR